MNSTLTNSYLPLTSHSEIRLLLLKPGPRASPIECSLIHTEIGKIPYDALSYEWGTQQPNEPTIYILDTPHKSHDNSHEPIVSAPRQIRNNLHVALSRIRLQDEERWLWVDALCINQTDNGERTHQVGMMGKIYRSARRVIAWLGEGNEDDVLAMGTFQRINKIARKLETIEIVATHDKDNNDKGVDFCELRAIVEWGLRRRVWIVQELVLARDLVLMVGSYPISGKEADLAMAAVEPFIIYPFGALGANEIVAKDLYSRWGNNLAFRLLLARRTFKFIDGPRGITLCDRILRCRDSECMDPRDRVYGLLGVSEDIATLEDSQLTLEVDHEKSLLALSRDVSRFWTAERGRSIAYGKLMAFLGKLFELSNSEINSAKDKLEES